MIMKEWKRSGRKRKTTPLFFLLIGSSSLICVILLSLYVYSLSSTVSMSPPAFEETYSTKSVLHEGIRRIDFAIFESLYRSGTPEKDIRFLDVQPRHLKGHLWDFTQLSVKCVDPESLPRLQEIITQELNTLGPGIRFQYEKRIDGNIICHVFVKDFYSHKIVLGFHTHQPSVEDVRPRIAIIIDDLGYDSEVAFSFIQLGLPLTFSLLPSAPFTERIAREASETGYEVMLHLPMEPKNYPSVNPGPGALLLSMDEYEIRQVLDKNLRKIPGVSGVNNHMGSAFTEDGDRIRVVLKELKKKNLFYIDSRTTNNSAGFTLASELGVPVAGRSVFLDNDIAPKAIKIQMERLLNLARHSGTAIGIAHPHKETLEILEEYSSRIKTDFRIVPVSELVS
jgi:polysaccharide deacetylase 2 family uncharacterized protein YibQ